MSDEPDQNLGELSVGRGQSISRSESNSLVKRGLESVLSNNSIRANELIEIGKRHYSIGESTKAVECFNDAVELKPSLAKFWHIGFRIYAAEEDFDSDSVVGTNDMTCPNIYYFNAMELKRAGRFEASIAEFSKAIFLDPEFQVAYNQRGIAYFESGDFDRALADFETDCMLCSFDGLGHVNRIGPLWQMGAYDLCIASIETCLRYHPEFAESGITLADAYNARGKNFFDKGKFDRAILDYNEAIRLKGDIDQAFAEIKEGTYVDDSIFSASEYYYNRGNAYQSKGDLPAAELDFAMARKLDEFWN